MECVGAPVFGPDGTVMGAISVSSLYKPTEDYEALGRRVCENAAMLSRLLGYIVKDNGWIACKMYIFRWFPVDKSCGNY